MKIQIITVFFGMLLFTGIVVPAVNANEFLETLGNVYMAEAAIAAGVGVVAPVTAPVALPVAGIVGGIGGLTFLIGTVCNPVGFHLCPLNPAIFTGWVQFSTNFSPTVFQGDLTPLLNNPLLLLLLNLAANTAACQAAADTGDDACFNTSFIADQDCASERSVCHQGCGAIPFCLGTCDSAGFGAAASCFDQGSNCFSSCSDERLCERSCIFAEDACVQPIFQDLVGACNLSCGGEPSCAVGCELTHSTCQDTRLAARDACLGAVDTELAACITRAENGSDLAQAYLDFVPLVSQQLLNVENWAAHARAMFLANEAGDIQRVNELALGLDAARNAIVAHAPTVDASAEAFGDALMMVRLDEGVVVDDAFVVTQLDRIQFQGLPISVEDALRNIFGWTQEAIDNGITAQMLQGLQALTPAEIAAQQDAGKDWSAQTSQWLVGINEMTDFTLNNLPGVCQDASQCPSDDCNAGVCTAGQCSTEPTNEGLACSGPRNFVCISGVCSDGSLPTDETKLLDKDAPCRETTDAGGSKTFEVTVSGEASDLQGIQKIEVIFSFPPPKASETVVIFADLAPPFDVIHPFSETISLSDLPESNIMIRVTDGEDNETTFDPPLVCLPPGDLQGRAQIAGSCGAEADPPVTDLVTLFNFVPSGDFEITITNPGNAPAEFRATRTLCQNDMDVDRPCTLKFAADQDVPFADKTELPEGPASTQLAEVVPAFTPITRQFDWRLELATLQDIVDDADKDQRVTVTVSAICDRDAQGNPNQVCPAGTDSVNGVCK